MRIIAGQARGTRLAGLKGSRVRPTLDRVRESLFNILGQNFSGNYFLDWFGGSGAVGIEALSRGAEKVVWAENDRQAQKLIYANLEKCQFWNGESESKSANWVLLKMDALQAVSVLEERSFQFDVVYIDPPFAEDLYEECLITISKSKLLKVSSIVVVEHHHKNSIQKFYDKLQLMDQRRVGDTYLSLYSLKSS